MKNIYPAGAALAAILLLSPAAMPAERKGKARQSAEQPVTRNSKAKSSKKAAAAAGVIAEVLGKNFTIPAASGNNPGTLNFDAVSDFSGAETAAIMVKAPGGSDLATVQDGFQIWVYWALPDTDWWAANDVISGSNFNFYIQGGGAVRVYGPEMRLTLVNWTNQAVAIDQLTVYAVSRTAAAATTPADPPPAQ